MTEAFQETQGYQVFLEKRVNKDHLELDFQAQLVLKESVEFREHQDYQESQEDQDRMVQLDSLVYLDKKVNLVWVFQVQKVHKVPKELLASREKKVAWECLAFLDEKDRQDHRDLRESKVRLGPLDLLDWLAYQVHQEKAHLELLDHKDRLENLDHSEGKV